MEKHLSEEQRDRIRREVAAEAEEYGKPHRVELIEPPPKPETTKIEDDEDDPGFFSMYSGELKKILVVAGIGVGIKAAFAAAEVFIARQHAASAQAAQASQAAQAAQATQVTATILDRQD